MPPLSESTWSRDRTQRWSHHPYCWWSVGTLIRLEIETEEEEEIQYPLNYKIITHRLDKRWFIPGQTDNDKQIPHRRCHIERRRSLGT